MKYLNYFEKISTRPDFKFEIGDIVKLKNILLSKYLYKIIDRRQSYTSVEGFPEFNKYTNSYKLVVVTDDSIKVKNFPDIWRKENNIRKASDLEIDTIKYNL